MNFEQHAKEPQPRIGCRWTLADFKWFVHQFEPYGARFAFTFYGINIWNGVRIGVFLTGHKNERSNQLKQPSIHKRAFYRLRHLIPLVSVWAYFLAAALYSGNTLAATIFSGLIIGILLLGLGICYLRELRQ